MPNCGKAGDPFHDAQDARIAQSGSVRRRGHSRAADGKARVNVPSLFRHPNKVRAFRDDVTTSSTFALADVGGETIESFARTTVENEGNSHVLAQSKTRKSPGAPHSGLPDKSGYPPECSYCPPGPFVLRGGSMRCKLQCNLPIHFVRSLAHCLFGRGRHCHLPPAHHKKDPPVCPASVVPCETAAIANG
jgi:hypothetical protein